MSPRRSISAADSLNVRAVCPARKWDRLRQVDIPVDTKPANKFSLNNLRVLPIWPLQTVSNRATCGAVFEQSDRQTRLIPGLTYSHIGI